MRVVTILGLVGLVALAGCTGPVGGPGDDGGTATSPATSADAPVTSADPPAEVSPDTTVAYAELTDYQRAAFRDAMDGGVQFVPNTSYVDESEGYRQERMGPFEENEFVEYEGRYYELDLAQGQGDLYAAYGISASPASPGANETVVALADLPASVRDEVRTAVTEGEYHAPYGKWDSLPEPLSDTEYVRYENATYRTGYVVGDNWATVMTVEELS